MTLEPHLRRAFKASCAVAASTTPFSTGFVMTPSVTDSTDRLTPFLPLWVVLVLLSRVRQAVANGHADESELHFILEQLGEEGLQVGVEV